MLKTYLNVASSTVKEIILRQIAVATTIGLACDGATRYYRGRGCQKGSRLGLSRGGSC
jgi:hypothetical protein